MCLTNLISGVQIREEFTVPSTYVCTCLLGESLWLELELIERMMKDLRQLFPVTRYASIFIPTYIGGQIGFILAGKNEVCVIAR